MAINNLISRYWIQLDPPCPRQKAAVDWTAVLICAWALMTGPAFLQADSSAPLVERLRETRAVNIAAIVEAQFPQARAAAGFTVADPYDVGASSTVQTWYEDPGRDKAVCAVRFVDPAKRDYELRNFATAAFATAAGYTVTHYGRCGSCSTLRDLSIYLARRDLTTPARHCALRVGLNRKKQCFQTEIGLTAFCAESWAYNARHTRQECVGTCIRDYGFFNLLFSRDPGPNTDEKGQLRPCLRCDEEQSGPGFKYSAGRTRRNSGIESAIPRPDTELPTVDHDAYFE